jgi:hypothetical protein
MGLMVLFKLNPKRFVGTNLRTIKNMRKFLIRVLLDSRKASTVLSINIL